MKRPTVSWTFFLTFLLEISCAEEQTCTTVDDFWVNNLNDTRCYLSCIASALKKLHNDGERKILLNEEMYTNVSSILDDMEGRKDESLKYLGVVGSAMRSEEENLGRLISYGNDMGDLVAKVGGMLAIFNQSVRAVRNTIPDALVKADEYYTAIEEVIRTVWSDIGAVKWVNKSCEGQVADKIIDLRETCERYKCPLEKGVNAATILEYKGGCLEIATFACSSEINETLNVPRRNLYNNGVIAKLSGTIKWHDGGNRKKFHLTLYIVKMFEPLLTVGTTGTPLPALQDMMANVTSLLSEFDVIYGNFTSILTATNLTGIMDTSSAL